DGKGGVDPPACNLFYDGLSVFPQAHRLEREFGVGLDQANDIPESRVRVPPENDVGPCQLEEVHGMGLDDLAHMDEFPQELCRTRYLDVQDLVAGLGCAQVVADGADPADARRYDRHLREVPPLGELLEPPELIHVKIGAVHLSFIVQVYGDLGVSF